MKTKNILITAFALAMFAAPVLAQQLDYHDKEVLTKEITDTIKTSVSSQKQYLDVAYLKAIIEEDLHFNEQKLLENAQNSIQDKKITDKEQYELMTLCIETNHNDILAVLLKAGFNSKLLLKEPMAKTVK